MRRAGCSGRWRRRSTAGDWRPAPPPRLQPRWRLGRLRRARDAGRPTSSSGSTTPGWRSRPRTASSASGRLIDGEPRLRFATAYGFKSIQTVVRQMKRSALRLHRGWRARRGAPTAAGSSSREQALPVRARRRPRPRRRRRRAAAAVNASPTSRSTRPPKTPPSRCCAASGSATDPRPAAARTQHHAVEKLVVPQLEMGELPAPQRCPSALCQPEPPGVVESNHSLPCRLREGGRRTGVRVCVVCVLGGGGTLMEVHATEDEGAPEGLPWPPHPPRPRPRSRTEREARSGSSPPSTGPPGGESGPWRPGGWGGAEAQGGRRRTNPEPRHCRHRRRRQATPGRQRLPAGGA